MSTLLSYLKPAGRVAIFAITAATLVAATPVENNIHKTFTVSPRGKLIVDADRGSIDIKTGAGDTVDIQVTRTLKGINASGADQVFNEHIVNIDQRGNEITVQSRAKDREWKWWRSGQSRLQVRYEISIPPEFNLDLQTAGGSITVPDLKGDVKVGTSGGNVRLGKIEGPIGAKTSGGNISVAGSSGHIDVRTTGGTISVKNAQAPLYARTTGGDIEVDNAENTSDLETSGGTIRIGKAIGKVLAKTTGGNIEVKESRTGLDASTSGGTIKVGLAGQPDGDCRLTTTGGDIQVNLPLNLSARIDARTTGGRVVSDLGVTTQGELKSSSLVGQIGQGGSLLTLRTTGGSIHLRKTDKQMVRE